MNPEKYVFCREVSLERSEPLAGTGVHQSSNLLISWPIGKWLKSLRKTKDMSDELLALADAIVSAGRRINLIDRKDQPEDVHRAYLMPENRVYDVPHASLVEFLTAVLEGTPLYRWFAGSVEGSLVLCCTHGNKDKCCAKYGYAAYQSLAAAAGKLDAPVEVWQSSHLGGCRLSASALVFPQMHKYGRIEPDQAEALLTAEINGEIYLPAYRGACHLDPQQQAAEVAARQWLADHQITGLVQIQVIEQQPDKVTIFWRAHNCRGSVIVSGYEDSVQRYGTCAEIDNDEAMTAVPVWRVTDVQPLNGGGDTADK
ncbi:sucrase ferredoxin [Gynuella sunshinyii]|uniref:Uncharacterized protein conserved in bacteria containing thioredoxin-like domain n=1 Tax=Gynuella sunshinyii YC6258 TaxID=1445510 RepID=A0A0C5VI40_9GAMM|nr:sucrase ferredoxin [Gynuella sunshinyii]AJQ94322.1 uncharacterized protein conserved in bacteria containing thioredoxin-like domain [Gynuella sunshinyii YC6258]